MNQQSVFTIRRILRDFAAGQATLSEACFLPLYQTDPKAKRQARIDEIWALLTPDERRTWLQAVRLDLQDLEEHGAKASALGYTSDKVPARFGEKISTAFLRLILKKERDLASPLHPTLYKTRPASACQNTKANALVILLDSTIRSLPRLHGAKLKKLILPGETFGNGWELLPPQRIGSSAEPGYINQTQPEIPLVTIEIRGFASAHETREQLEKILGSDEFKDSVKKLSDDPLSYEVTEGIHKKRYLLVKNYWLTVDQTGKTDDREIFIQKYTEHLDKNT